MRCRPPLLVREPAGRSKLDSVPKLLASPRSVGLGHDSTVSVYIAAYGQQNSLPVNFVVQNDRGTVTLRDTAILQRSGGLLAGAVAIPISRVGIGIANVTFTRADATDTVRTPVFVSFGNDIPLLSFDELLNQLRYYVSPERVGAPGHPCRSASTGRGTFLRSSDPSPHTAEPEGFDVLLTSRAARSVQDERPRSRGGWLSDRARVFVILASPTAYEQNTNSAIRGRDRTTWSPSVLGVLHYGEVCSRYKGSGVANDTSERNKFRNKSARFDH